MLNIEYLNEEIKRLSLSEETSIVNIVLGRVSVLVEPQVWKIIVDRAVASIKGEIKDEGK